MLLCIEKESALASLRIERLLRVQYGPYHRRATLLSRP